MKGAIIGFILGAVAGGAAVYFSLKGKMEKEKNDEINAALESIERVAKEQEEAAKETMNDILYKEGYTFGEDTEEPIEPEEEGGDPYILDNPLEFGEKDDWETRYFEYYDDGVVIDEQGGIVPYPESMLGTEFDAVLRASNLGEIYVANPNTKTYFEILATGYKYNDDFEEEDSEYESDE